MYIIAALIWWFIALNTQNNQMAEYELSQLIKDNPQYNDAAKEILEIQKRKRAQYLGEGAVFFLLIGAGAFYIFRAVVKQFRQSRQQQHFMMTITHELKTPIAVTKLNLETLQKRKLDEAQQAHIIQNTIQEANRLNTLCNNLLLSSQIDTGGHAMTKEEIDLSELAQSCIRDFSMRFPKRKLNSSIQEGILIEGDKLMLQMAINNLIDNALKYSGKEAAIAVSLSTTDRSVKLKVADEGKGIDQSEKKKIFDKYYRIGNKATKEAKGTGLGLYLTRKILKQHNASIQVEDNTPTGSIFVISFKQ